MIRDWLKREPDPFWSDNRTIRVVSDADVLREAARIIRERGHTLPASVLEKWADEVEPKRAA